VVEFGPAYVRQRTPAELKRILERNAQRGLPGCMGSLDCSHWEWANCPKAFAGMYQNRHRKRSVVMETVCDEDQWIWHLFVGCPGSQNDLNVMHASPLYLSVTGGEWAPRTFSYTANGTTCTLLYYLVDGIYPPFAFFVSPFPDPTTEVETTFNRLQEALKKYEERLYAVLTARCSGGGGTGFMPDGGGPAAGVGAAGGGAAGGGGGGTGLSADEGSNAAGSGAAGGSLQSNANSPRAGDGPSAGAAAPVIAPAGALPARSFGHALNA